MQPLFIGDYTADITVLIWCHIRKSTESTIEQNCRLAGRFQVVKLTCSKTQSIFQWAARKMSTTSNLPSEMTGTFMLKIPNMLESQLNL